MSLTLLGGFKMSSIWWNFVLIDPESRKLPRGVKKWGSEGTADARDGSTCLLGHWLISPTKANASLHLTPTHAPELCPESTDKHVEPEGYIKYGPVITTMKKELWCSEPGVNSGVLAKCAFVCNRGSSWKTDCKRRCLSVVCLSVLWNFLRQTYTLQGETVCYAEKR